MLLLNASFYVDTRVDPLDTDDTCERDDPTGQRHHKTHPPVRETAQQAATPHSLLPESPSTQNRDKEVIRKKDNTAGREKA